MTRLRYLEQTYVVNSLNFKTIRLSNDTLFGSRSAGRAQDGQPSI